MARIYTWYLYNQSNSPLNWIIASGPGGIKVGDIRFFVDYNFTQEIANNRTIVTAQLYVQNSNNEYPGWHNENRTCSVTIGGETFYRTFVSNTSIKGTIAVGSQITKIINHNSVGNPPDTYIQGYGLANMPDYNNPWPLQFKNYNDSTVNTKIVIPAIPRYATITSLNAFSNGLTSIGVSWTADSFVDLVQYAINDGGWIEIPKELTFYINNLYPGTAYNVRIRIRRQDSQLWTESGYVYATTSDIAKITSGIPNGNSDNALRVTSNNSSGQRGDIKLEFPDIGNYEVIKKTNTTDTTFTASEMLSLANLIPNLNSTKLRATAVTVVNGVDTYFNFVDGIYTVINANPTFNNFTYQDTNSITTALTGNNQRIIKGYSNLRATISTANKAAANKGANMVNYQLVIGTKQINTSYSSSSAVNLNLDAIDNNVFMVYAIDSRGNSTVVQKSPTTFIDYFKPVISGAIATRQNQIGTQTTLNFNGSFFNASFGNTTNNITATYRYKKTSDSNWTNGTTNINPTKSGNNFSVNKLIAGDLGANGFNQNFSYNIEITVIDSLDSNKYNFILGTGRPNIAIHRNGVAFNAPYNEEIGGPLQIEGKNIFDLIYPIGFIYISVNSTNPSSMFGGTWISWGNGRVPVGIDTSQTEFNTVEKTGGAKTHTLTENQIPNHRHTGLYWNGNKISFNTGTGGYMLPWASGGSNDETYFQTGYTGGGQAHPIMQPYITCYMWKRTA